jgi:hypothetical protein
LFVITTHRSESLTNYISYPASKTTATFGLNSGGRFIVGQEKSDSSPMSQLIPIYSNMSHLGKKFEKRNALQRTLQFQ